MKSRRRFLRDSAMLLGATSFWSGSLRAEDEATEFDFVVIGAGSSGCVLASRLSAEAATRVLVIEAGGPEARHPAVQEPGRWTTLLGTQLDWAYATEPEPGLDGRVVQWPRGRVHGGSSTINAMSYVRGHRLSFDRWAAASDDSWSYREVLPLFRGVEDNSRGASEYLGAGGPLAVADTTDPHAGHLAFLEAARELGFDAEPQWDFNGPRQENGAGFYQKNIRAGRRHSAAAAFLAAGVIESPRILMLSGIGPAGALTRLGIPVRVDAPGVGANLHDRPRVAVRWAGRRRLPPSSVSAGLFTWARQQDGLPPDVQFYVGRGVDEPDDFITLTVALGMPRSRGSLALRSADPDAPPVIRAGYFREPHDMDVMLEGVRMAQTLAATPAYDDLRGDPLEPSAGASSPEALRAFVRATAETIFHPVGTCRMGRDADAVVDPGLRVRGVERLWVADASIMPELVNAQTHAACVMIGERAASLLLGWA